MLNKSQALSRFQLVQLALWFFVKLGSNTFLLLASLARGSNNLSDSHAKSQVREAMFPFCKSEYIEEK